MFVINIRYDSDDPVRRRADPGGKLQHRIGPVDMPIDWVLIREHALRKGLTDDDDGIAFCAVGIVEITAPDYGNSEGGKESGRDHAHLRARIFIGDMNVAVSRELEGDAAVAPGRIHAESSGVHAGYGIDPANRLLIEIYNLLRRFSVGHDGNVDDQDVTRVEARSRPLQRDQRRDQHSRAGQQHERGRDLCHREDPLAAARAAGDSYAAAR